jgi:hypothetical protein
VPAGINESPPVSGSWSAFGQQFEARLTTARRLLAGPENGT